jgi:4-hydroxy-2-oxoheptanedioate aldolase
MRKAYELKKALKKGKVIYGPWCTIPSASVINIIASTGVDFVIIDMEHGAHTFETVEQMIRAAEVENCSPFVRVARNDESLVLNALDLGAHGVVIPHIELTSDAKMAVASAKYYPMGTRGFSPFTRAGGYSKDNVRIHAESQNEETLVILILEGKESIDRLEDVLAMEYAAEGIDVIYVGAYDLSQALGLPGQVDHPEVRKRLEISIKKIRKAGIAAGGYVAKNVEDIRWMKEMGMQLITLLPDCTIFFHAFEAFYPGIFRVKIEPEKE